MHLFSPLDIRSVMLPNRIVVSPMCQYSSEDGFANDWHLVHLGSRAVGGAGLVMAEATAVVPEGRISPQDLGLWKDEHIEFLSRITSFIASQRAIPAIQLAHAGRKASTRRPWEGGGTAPIEEGGWLPVYGPSAIPFSERALTPEQMSCDEIRRITQAFADAASRALRAGFKIVEIHGAHGYLLHAFLSPLSNNRTDEYGGSYENRTRFVKEVTRAVRQVWPDELPLFMRLSSTDWVEGGWDVDQTVLLAQELQELGVDLIDCSSGGTVAGASIPIGPGYQVSFAQAVRQGGVLSGAVGMITEPEQADEIIRSGKADVVLLARELLRDPYWPMRAAKTLGVEHALPKQYERAWL
jgi:2,4-dienoyl-CoA reductase-like NADH-dependent reductase (Old Yellow Enzyme family)